MSADSAYRRAFADFSRTGLNSDEAFHAGHLRLKASSRPIA